ncbi:MAG TPA: MBL fold metallo-hydrolase, partial [Thermoleophilia bacterium]|nr:MBL fold metallo-hydrolase [Thermoleophilia bacterium]
NHSGRRHSTGGKGEALGFVVRGQRSIYVACLPIDGWGPRLPEDHLDPLRAAQALEMLRPRIAVPIHWGSYYPPALAEMWRGRRTMPPRTFTGHAARLAPQVEVRVLEPGEGFAVPAATPAV